MRIPDFAHAIQVYGKDFLAKILEAETKVFLCFVY